jgi:hypothetical protein
MSGLPNGKYRTAAGSTLTVSGKHSGKAAVEFDWLEEEGSCCDCQVNAYPEFDHVGWYLTWSCDVCDGGRALLSPVQEDVDE